VVLEIGLAVVKELERCLGVAAAAAAVKEEVSKEALILVSMVVG
jgi:hypothetical protein